MITRVQGFLVGHANDFENLTGCTVILCPPGTVGSADIRGSAAGTRQMDALVGLHIVDEIHGVCIAGGSAFGLDAGGGALQYLEQRGRGFDVAITRVPIVPTAVIYDLSVGTMGTRVMATSNPRPRCSRYSRAPPPASSPKALPPALQTP
jgi:L-aminopeptidase/D-esterase-like protein